MNSVSPSAAQYIGGVMQDELVETRRQQPLDRQGSFGLRPQQTPDLSREATGEPDEMDKLKAKLMSAWNNVKYGLCSVLKEECVVPLFSSMCMCLCIYFPASLSIGWTVKSKTSFNKISPVTVLGHSYLLNSEGKLCLQKCILKISMLIPFSSKVPVSRCYISSLERETSRRADPRCYSDVCFG